MRSVWFVLLACSPHPSLTSSDPCMRAWVSQREAVLALHEAAGKTPPSLPDDAVAVRACRALKLSAEQQACLDPLHARSHRGLCDTVLPEAQRAPWNAWLLEHVAGATELY